LLTAAKRAAYRGGAEMIVCCIVRERGDMSLSKFRAGLESVIALAAGILGVTTIFWHDWIEALTGWDPDRHNGTAEWLVVVTLLMVAALAGVAARRDWRLLAAARGMTSP
jgi:hypothetical protein